MVLYSVPLFSLSYQATAQEGQAPSLESVAIVTENYPEISLIVDVLSATNQPVLGLASDDFRLMGPDDAFFTLASVETVVGTDLPVAVVLTIDTSQSMIGRPIATAKSAALAFVESMTEDDMVALVSFSSRAELIQDYTSDKDILSTAIQTIAPRGGQTALYDATAFSIEVAQQAPIERHAIILLSDGAEYGAVSDLSRTQALGLADSSKIAIYTIGLGYGADRSYLGELANLTKASSFESPTGESLSEIYSGVFGLLRTQYRLNLIADIPQDGNDYSLDLQAVVENDVTNLAHFNLSAPIPVPLVSIAADTFPDDPLEFIQPITVIPTVIADDIIFQIDALIDTLPLEADGTTYTIDPFELSPGEHRLQFRVTDNDGDVGLLNESFIVPVLATATSTPTATATITPTATPQPPTATATITPTATPQPPTATETPQPPTATETPQPPATAATVTSTSPEFTALPPTVESLATLPSVTQTESSVVTVEVAPSATAPATSNLQSDVRPGALETLEQIGNTSEEFNQDEELSNLETRAAMTVTIARPTASLTPSPAIVAQADTNLTSTPTLTPSPNLRGTSQRSVSVAGRDALILIVLAVIVLGALLWSMSRELRSRHFSKFK